MLELGETEGELEEERRGAAWGGGSRGGYSRGSGSRGSPTRFGGSPRQPRSSATSWPKPSGGSTGRPPGPWYPRPRPRWLVWDNSSYPLAFVPQPYPSGCICPSPAPYPQGALPADDG